MLALHRLRCLPHSTPFQSRALRTLPRVIPTYVPRWDPTLHKSTRPATAVIESTKTAENPVYDPDRSLEREQLRDAHISIVTPGLSAPGKRLAVKRLDRVLELVNSTNGRDASLRAPLWRAYSLAKASDTTLLARLPERAWDLLWITQSIDSSNNANRTAHMAQLYRDMDKAGRTTTAGQRARDLESTFLSGREDQALKEWEEDHTLGFDGIRQDYKPEHLEVGAKLHALAGNLDRSRSIMEELLRLYPSWDASVMMTVFRAHTSSELQEHHDLAKQIYVSMKEKKGDARSIKDYDAWLVGFLESRNLGYAKQVFRDMVREGYLATSGTGERVEQVLKRLHMLYRLGTDIAAMTSIAFDAISVLPPAYHGHLFGDWMKAAVVRQAPLVAAQVMEMMLKRGYKPQTFHFNMLLKALIRTKESPNVLKAEDIGWRMIEAARTLPQQRDLPRDTAARIIDKRTADTHNKSTDIVQRAPPANVTTFALIMQHHAKSLQWEHVDYLSRQLKETALEPNATIMNVLMDNKCRQGAYSEAWTIYKTLTEPQEGDAGVFPNGASIRCLWKTLRLALGDPTNRDKPGLPTPRELLAEMISWWTLSRSRYDADRFRMGLAGADSGAITSLIMHCFSYTQDLAGSLIALHVLRHYFDIFPTNEAARILQGQIAWVDMTRETEAVRSSHFHSRSNKKNTDRITMVYNILLQRRLARMDLKESEYEMLTDEQIGDMGLNLLSEFVRVVLKRSYPPEVVEVMIDAARCAVGVPDLPTGDMDAFEVA
ncbi:uncharacterized protein J4E87_009896 [Alternaria ethzedia]|uniref:uncharacterized protein n=1 Tax=Alternaria ethzedia TaxID=181014 RepID=UPI0020C52441|nr:uncharacterized protein J4E87_009896 [Alternaria ethzedia]KAI4613429.1 hypothetical protein J4E87_009896 [Alternaria ethzedia]